ncbi:acyltransferase family protein [Cellulomonas aerilata]|uniref:acyltransferase family protein n=1 Tax=Cellulomonas aerilata TaxID=515326 RepID=UPI00164A090A|nr:acyltransferase family protein [Cellulomonas aerilata]
MRRPTLGGPARGDVRLDIQVLRALAVGLVLLYHLWPDRLPGGFVGVDVFFVISGLLITSHLLRSAVSPGGVRLGRFWANRARRLLPLASVVLLATAAGTFAFLPESAWRPTLRNLMASALYVENWSLAASSVDYLARDQAPLATQHFWSLSVEEQFYLAWPVIVVLAAGWAVRRARGRHLSRAVVVRRGVMAVMVAIFALSLACSVWLTATDPGTAYFATTTRAWEFAAGGLLAMLPTAQPAAGRPVAVRTAGAVAGLAAIVASALVLSDATPFPGTAALLPVLGTAVFLWAGRVPGASRPAVAAALRPVRYLGDISYGVYLWHWPLVVIVPAALGGPLGTAAKVGVLAVTVMLAAASKVLVEDPFRYRPFWLAPVRRGFYPAAAGIAAVVLVCVTGLGALDRAAARAADLAAARPDQTLSTPTDPDAPLAPTLADRPFDNAGMYDCFDLEHLRARSCTYGPADAAVSVAITGDSHAAHLLPPLISLAERRGWRLTTYVGISCDAGLAPACADGPETFDTIVGADHDVVLFSAFRGSGSDYDDVRTYVTALHDAGVRLLPVADVPMNPPTTYACIDDSGGDAGEAARCTTPRDEALERVPDRVTRIADELGTGYLDLTDAFCDGERCRAVSGNTIVYQDSPSSHLTATFGRELVPLLEAGIDEALGTAAVTRG